MIKLDRDSTLYGTWFISNNTVDFFFFFFIQDISWQEKDFETKIFRYLWKERYRRYVIR